MKEDLLYLIQKKREFWIHLNNGDTYHIDYKIDKIWDADKDKEIDIVPECICESFDDLGIKVIEFGNFHVLIPWSSISKIEYFILK